MQLPAATIRDTVAAVFRDPAYNRTSPLENFFSWLAELISAIWSRIAPRGAPTPVFWVVVIAAGGLLLILLARWGYMIYESRERRAGRSTAGMVAGVAQEADAWQRARALAAAGDYTSAAHMLYAGLIRAFERQGAVEPHESKTIGDYLRDLSTRSSAQLGRFREFARSYELVIYGVGSCDRATYERLLELAGPIIDPGSRMRARVG